MKIKNSKFFSDGAQLAGNQWAKSQLFPTLLALALLTVTTLSAAPLTVAVYDFTGIAGRGDYGVSVTTLVAADLTTETNLVMLERAELNKALSEQAFGISGLVSSDAAAKIGKITGAKVLVSGQIIKTGTDHLVIVADIIGTETGRLFADKVEGGADSLVDLTTTLSGKIARTISDQATNLIAATEESHAARLDRIVKSIAGTNRPSVSVSINFPQGPRFPGNPANTELGRILLKAGFPVVDNQSDRKPDIEITGMIDVGRAGHHGSLACSHATLELKVQERRSGEIITFDRQEADGIDAGFRTANRLAQVNAVDAIAERILPLLAK